MSNDDFAADPQLQLVAEQAAGKCVAFLMQKFGRSLDYSDGSVADIEAVLTLLHASIPAEKPSEDDIEDFAMLFGSYLGETYRRNHGGQWGISNGMPALAIGSGYSAYPWSRVFKRLTNGEEDEVCGWYASMIQYGALGSSQPAAAPPPLPVNPPPLPAKKKNPFDFFGR